MRIVSVVLFLVLLLGTVVGAQTAPPPAAVFRSRTELVLIPTIVTSPSGEHVRGLNKRDFTILQDGTPQAVSVFEEIETTKQPVQRARDGEHEFSNYFVGDPRRGRLTILLLDLRRVGFEDQVWALDSLKRYLPKVREAGEPTALITLDWRGIHVVHDLAGEGRSLLSLDGPISRLEPFVADPLSTGSGDRAAAALGYSGPIAPHLAGERSDPNALGGEAAREMAYQGMATACDANRFSVTALQVLAAAYAGFPGRKALVWINDNKLAPGSAGERTGDACDWEGMLRQMSKALSDAQIALYSVSTAGLVAPSGGGTAEWNSQLGRWAFNWGPLSDLAAQTGGRAFYGQNDLELGYAQAAKDSAHYYLIGYYLKPGAAPGWHKLAVHTRRQGAKLRARSGFWVSPPDAHPEATLETDFALASQSPFDYTAIPLKLTLGATRPGEIGRKVVDFRLQAMAGGFLIDEADSNHVLLDIGVVVITPDDKRPVHFTRKLEAHLRSASLQKARSGGLTYDSEIELPAGDYTLRVIVRDAHTGRTGSVSAPLRVD